MRKFHAFVTDLTDNKQYDDVALIDFENEKIYVKGKSVTGEGSIVKIIDFEKAFVLWGERK